jgi:uncharacterized membrane protein
MQHLIRNKLILYSAILAFFGLLDAGYLTILHYKNIIPPCSVHFGCETVLTSTYSMLGPIPVALLGVVFYLTVIIVGLLILVEGKNEFLQFFHFVAAVGFLVSIVLFFIQFYLIHSFCQYCLLSEVISVGIFVLSLLKFRQDRKSN